MQTSSFSSILSPIISGRSLIRFHISQAVCFTLKLIPEISFKGCGLFALSVLVYWKTEIMLLSSGSERFFSHQSSYNIWYDDIYSNTFQDVTCQIWCSAFCSMKVTTFIKATVWFNPISWGYFRIINQLCNIWVIISSSSQCPVFLLFLLKLFFEGTKVTEKPSQCMRC